MKQLSHEEMVALAGSARVLMEADGRVSQAEADRVADFARELGISKSQWMAVWDEAVRTLPSTKAVEAAAAVQRAEAREVVYELLYKLAMEGTIVDAEWDLLEWLDETWMAAPATE